MNAIVRGACASLTWQYMTGYIVERSQVSGISVVLWENLAPAIHVTLETVLQIPFMKTVFPKDRGLSRQDNTPCHKAKKG